MPISLNSTPAQNSFEIATAHALIRSADSLKLHLGCGARYFEGYLNIDFPPEGQSIMRAKVDAYADILRLKFPANSVDEVRSHHVFEHFDRVEALALLSAWRKWIKPTGRLVIETPDLGASIDLLNKLGSDVVSKQRVLRHVFGSHEAAWAVHKDGWDEEKYLAVLPVIGFKIEAVEKTEWQLTRNIIVTAVPEGPDEFTMDQVSARAAHIFEVSLVDHSESELELHRFWLSRFQQLLAFM